MRKLMLLVVGLLMVVPAKAAREMEGNPDRFPSVGLSYEGAAADGTYKSAGTSQDVETVTGALILDTRLPLSRSFTLGLALGAISSEVTGDDSPTLFSSKTEESGAYVRISGRYYFNH